MTLPGYRRVADLAWCAPEHAWVLQFTLRVPVPPEEISDATIPEVTAWVTLIAPEYPHGRLVTFPADHGGITGTYPHQKPNLPPQSGRWWRQGEICVTTPYASYGRAGYDVEPRAGFGAPHLASDSCVGVGRRRSPRGPSKSR